MTKSQILTINNLTLRYPNGVEALKNVSLKVKPGEIIALLGPSGSGKSTLLRAVAGLEPFQRGTIFWGSQDLAKIPPHKRDFGFMFQDGQLFTHKDVAGNIEYALNIQKVPARERYSIRTKLLEKVGLPGYEKRSVVTLSGGQAQRVALARALAASPKLLMLDEPLSSLDKKLKKQLAIDLGSILRSTKTSSILVTHDEEEARAIADRIVRLEEGKLL